VATVPLTIAAKSAGDKREIASTNAEKVQIMAETPGGLVHRRSPVQKLLQRLVQSCRTLTGGSRTGELLADPNTAVADHDGIVAPAPISALAPSDADHASLPLAIAAFVETAPTCSAAATGFDDAVAPDSPLPDEPVTAPIASAPLFRGLREPYQYSIGSAVPAMPNARHAEANDAAHVNDEPAEQPPVAHAVTPVWRAWRAADTMPGAWMLNVVGRCIVPALAPGSKLVLQEVEPTLGRDGAPNVLSLERVMIPAPFGVDLPAAEAGPIPGSQVVVLTYTRREQIGSTAAYYPPGHAGSRASVTAPRYTHVHIQPDGVTIRIQEV
jgi:hypothetical protein